MEISIAKIQKATCRLSKTTGILYLCIIYKIKNTLRHMCFDLSDENDLKCFSWLMNSLKSYKFEDLTGKVFRVVFSTGLVGIGDPIEDRFIPLFTKNIKVVSQLELKKMLSSTKLIPVLTAL